MFIIANLIRGISCFFGRTGPVSQETQYTADFLASPALPPGQAYHGHKKRAADQRQPENMLFSFLNQLFDLVKLIVGNILALQQCRKQPNNFRLACMTKDRSCKILLTG